MFHSKNLFLLAAALAAGPVAAQDKPDSMGGMKMSDMKPAGMFVMDLASGTSANPASSPLPMIMTHFGSWNTMLMGVGFVSDIQQTGQIGRASCRERG